MNMGYVSDTTKTQILLTCVMLALVDSPRPQYFWWLWFQRQSMKCGEYRTMQYLLVESPRDRSICSKNDKTDIDVILTDFHALDDCFHEPSYEPPVFAAFGFYIFIWYVTYASGCVDDEYQVHFVVAIWTREGAITKFE